MFNNVADVPRGWYMPVSHSLMVCCLVPNFWESSLCVIRRCFLKAWIFCPSQINGPSSRFLVMQA